MADDDLKDIFGEESDGESGRPGVAIADEPPAKRARTEQANSASSGSDSSGSESESDDSGSSSGSDDSSGSDSGSESDSSSSSASSSASEAPKSRLKMKKAGLLKKKLRTQREARPQREIRKKQPLAEGAPAAKEKSKGGESGDEYESEPEVQATAEDLDFIDRDEDDEELLREYDDMKQDFQDERPDGPKKKKKTKARARSDSEADGAEKPTKGGKRKREMSDKEKIAIVSALLDDMVKAAAKDRVDKQAGKPAVHKLQLLPRVKQVTANTALQTMLLEGCNTGSSSIGTDSNPTILSVLRLWLRPLPGADLPALALRDAIYDIIDRLPVRLDDLKFSRIGEVLFAMSQHPSEDKKNKEKLGKMIERFSRSIFGKSDRYKGSIDSILESQRQLGLVSTKPAATPAPTPAAVAGHAAAGFGELLGEEPSSAVAATTGASVFPEPKMRHAKIPQSVTMDFVARPHTSGIVIAKEKAQKAKEGLAHNMAVARRQFVKKAGK